MTIKIVDGDLLEASEDIIGHQCNLMGKMGSGVALQVKRKYFNAYLQYRELLLKRDIKKEELGEEGREMLLGTYQLVHAYDKQGNIKLIANIFGQHEYGSGKQFTKTEKLKQALEGLKEFCRVSGKSLALPYKIGSDRGGADWNEVYKIIDEAYQDYEVTLYRYNG